MGGLGPNLKALLEFLIKSQLFKEWITVDLADKMYKLKFILLGG